MHQLTYKKAALKVIRKMPKPQALKLQSELEAMAKALQVDMDDLAP